MQSSPLIASAYARFGPTAHYAAKMAELTELGHCIQVTINDCTDTGDLFVEKTKFLNLSTIRDLAIESILLL